MLKVNLIADTDSYKHGHPMFMNPQITFQYSYGEARVKARYPQSVMVGMSILLQKYFSAPITQDDLEEAIEVNVATHGFCTLDVDVWQRVIDEGGFLPIIIKSAPEGSIVGIDNVLFTIESTKEWFAKSVQIIEGLMMHIWYPVSIATRSYTIYKSIKGFYEETGSLENLAFAVNDFGFRGATCRESAIIAGMMHLLFFDGSDNMPASRGLKNYYKGAPLKGKSVLATEHSVPLSYGRAREIDYILTVLKNTPKDKAVSIVIDTYDTYGFIRNVVTDPEVKKLIIERTGRTIFRPDSGDALRVPIDVMLLLEEIFGSLENEKGYRVLNHNVGVIQGDGMDEESIPELYRRVVALGYSADNIVTGSGGGLHQKDITRDTQRFAIKPSFGIIDGVDFNFKKNPATDTTKTSKSGRLKLHPSRNTFSTISSSETTTAMFNSYVDVLETVYENGKITLTPYDKLRKTLDKAM